MKILIFFWLPAWTMHRILTQKISIFGDSFQKNHWISNQKIQKNWNNEKFCTNKKGLILFCLWNYFGFVKWLLLFSSLRGNSRLFFPIFLNSNVNLQMVPKDLQNKLPCTTWVRFLSTLQQYLAIFRQAQQKLLNVKWFFVYRN